MNAPGLRETVRQAKRQVQEARLELRERHDQGVSGFEIAAVMTDRVDAIVLELLRAALAETAEDSSPLQEQFALVALGGYGRRDLAPYSDIDLMVLLQPQADALLQPVVRRLSHDLYDSGLQLGLSVREPREACQLALGDATIFTALAEARYLSGNVSLFEAFRDRFARVAQRRAFSLIESATDARREERAKYGETVYLLCPNVKRSRGGLRDLQLIRWMAFARFGETDYDRLAQQGVLTQIDLESLLAAKDFLLRVRNELHFAAGKPQDLLTREEQVRMADKFGYRGCEGVLPVEQFMQDYFQHTSQVRYIAANFGQSVRSRFGLRQIVGPVFSFSVGSEFRVGPVHVTATRSGLKQLSTSLVSVLRLMDLSNAYNRRIDHETWMSVRDSMTRMQVAELTREVAQRFLAILGETNRLGPLLRRMHELRVLEKIVPPFREARCLLQFNEYHKYTVDEHSIRAVEAILYLAQGDGLVAEVYQSLRRRQLLHLATLMHDLGKGSPRDHSERGAELAEQTCIRLGLSPEETQQVHFLVLHHLKMSHLAFRRDLNDESVIAEFAALVGSVETLKMLYVLTCADLHAVGPDVLNDWKQSLLDQLYLLTLNQLTGRPSRHPDYAEAERRKASVLAYLADSEMRPWFEQALDAVPETFFQGLSAASALKRLEAWRDVTEAEPVVMARELKETQAIEVIVAAIDRPHSGIFHRITGCLTSARMEILQVEALELGGQRVVNRFVVEDLESAQRPADQRLAEVTQTIRQRLLDPEDRPPAFRKIWQPSTSKTQTRAHRLPTRVQIDNESSESFTIIDVFAHDRLGLLYDVSRGIYELGLEVRVAKIGTYLDQVVDVFYVSTSEGEKVYDEQQLADIRRVLLEKIGDGAT